MGIQQAVLDEIERCRVGYDCGGVAVLYQAPRQEAVMAAEPGQAEGLSPSIGPTM